MDPVAISDKLRDMHPVEFLKMYRDTLYGFEGKATNVTYLASGSIQVLLTTTGDESESMYFNVNLLESMNGGKLNPDVDPEHPIDLMSEYKDDITEFTGKAAAISYSVSKCVQVSLAKAVNGKPADRTTDIQNLIPINGSKEHNLTSDITPGHTNTPIPRL